MLFYRVVLLHQNTLKSSDWVVLPWQKSLRKLRKLRPINAKFRGFHENLSYWIRKKQKQKLWRKECKIEFCNAIIPLKSGLLFKLCMITISINIIRTVKVFVSYIKIFYSILWRKNSTNLEHQLENGLYTIIKLQQFVRSSKLEGSASYRKFSKSSNKRGNLTTNYDNLIQEQFYRNC